MRAYSLPALLLLSVLYSSVVQASSPVSHVGGAAVNAGELSTEFRVGYTLDEKGASSHRRFRARQHLDYGLNDWYALRLITQQDKRVHDNLEHQAITVENRIQLIEKATHGWDGGIRLIYSQSDGDKTPHEAELRFLAQVPFSSDWEWRHNTMLEYDIGSGADDGVLLEFRNQISRALPVEDNSYLRKLAVGLDMYNDFGRLADLHGYDQQDHQLGPMIKASFAHGLSLYAGYRTGISEKGADHLFAFSIGKKW